MKKASFALFMVSLLSSSLQAQVCDPSVAPAGLTSTYTPGSGVLLQWDAVPGSAGVQLRVDLPSGSTIKRRVIGFERDQYTVPEALLTPGVYTWRVQAACSPTPPYNATMISASNTFTVGDGSTCPSTVADLDGNVYSTIDIGGQCWMAENLKVEQYRNGNPVSGVPDSIAWTATTSGAFAAYDNLPERKDTYGLLYNWYAVADTRGLCPAGWHVPVEEEWTQLIDYLGGDSLAGGPMKTTGTLSAGTGLWEDPNTAATNSSGFSGLPGGNRGEGGVFDQLAICGSWWSSSETSASNASYWSLHVNNANATRYTVSKQGGLSVRCLRD